MHLLRVVIGIVWKVLFVINGLIFLLVGYPFFRLLLSRKEWFPIAFKLKRVWTNSILFCAGIVSSIERRYPIKERPHASVYVANHASYLDVLSAYAVLPHYFVSMGKKELERVPLFNIFFKEMNIVVNRKSIRDAHKAFVRSCDEIEKGNSVFIFPEGGILNNKGELHRFKNGAFKLAIEKQVPIVPVTFLNNWKLFQHGVITRTYGRPGISRVVIHPPIPTIGMTEKDLVSLRTQVHDVIANELLNYNSKKK